MNAWMIRLLIFAAILAPPAGAGTCDKWILGFNVFQMYENKALVSKVATFRLADWSSNSTFEGIRLAKSPPPDDEALTLEIEVVTDKGRREFSSSELLPIELMPDTLQFSELDMRDTFGVKGRGKYTVRLKSGEKKICEQSYKFR